LTSKRYGTEIFDRLAELALPPGSYAVFGSGPLLLLGVIDSVNDLDVICLEPAWDIVRQQGELVDLTSEVQIVSLLDGALTFGRSWGYGSFDIRQLIATADDIDGIPCVRLEHVIAYKKLAGRPKDLEHLSLIERHLNQSVPGSP
jgi:hypothetical protein